MSRRRLLQSIDAARVKSAIQMAEQGSSGHVRVSVAAPFWGDTQEAAWRAFDRLEMHRTPHRNAVLLLVVPYRRRLVILGDAAIHDKVGHAFWQQVSHSICERFRAGDSTGGLEHGLQAIGDELRRHFPSDSTGIPSGHASA